MSVYSNQVNVGIADIARIDFNEQKPDGSTVNVAAVVIPYEVFKNMANIMLQTIQQYEENVRMQKEANKKLS